MYGYTVCSGQDTNEREKGVIYLHQGLEYWLQRVFQDADNSGYLKFFFY